MRIRKNDQVMVIAGNFRGKKGRVLRVFPTEDRVIVEGVNFVKKHTRPSNQNPKGGIFEKEAPIHASNVMIICPKTNLRTRVGHKIVTDSSKGRKYRIRISKKSGEMLPG